MISKNTGKEKVKLIKIGREALYEFIRESLEDGQKNFMDVEPTEVTDTFYLDWDRGELIFCTHRVEDDNGDIVCLSDKIDLQKLIENLPDTTDTMYKPDRYREFTMEELEKLSE